MGMLFGRPSDNKAVRSTPTATVPIIINGDATYPSAPAKDQDPQYPMSNLLSPSRYKVWSTKVGNADSSILLQIDLSGGSILAGAGGADKTISSVGLLGSRGHAGSLGPSSALVNYRTRAQGYAATGYTNIATINPGGNRDSIGQFTSTAMRYLELSILYQVEGFELGMVWAGVLQDLGIFWSSDGGATWHSEHNVLLTPTPGGHLTGVTRGDPWAMYTMSFRAIDAGKKGTIDSNFGELRRAQHLLILDELGVPRQFIVLDGPEFTQRFDGLYDATLHLQRLG